MHLRMKCLKLWFQHTAARRRLDAPADEVFEALVSTHSRPKAAADLSEDEVDYLRVSTHSRPKAAGDLIN